jgi:hypothetical protein
MGGVTVELSSDESLELSSEESLEELLELSSEESSGELLELSSEESSGELLELSSCKSLELSILPELSVPPLELLLSLNPQAATVKVIPKHKMKINNFFITLLLFMVQKEREAIRYRYNLQNRMSMCEYNHNNPNEL